MKGAVLVQTCDLYHEFWHGFVYYMKQHWDASIPWPVYFSNEEVKIRFQEPFYRHLPVGKGSYIQRLKRALHLLSEYDCVFYMLEDFWPHAPMPAGLFLSLFELFQKNSWDSLQVSPCLPYYKLERTDYSVRGKRLLKFSSDSDWLFSQQARFWRREFLLACLAEPEVSETIISTSLSAEMTCDRLLKERFARPEIYLYHYFWYPISGVVYRGKYSEVGAQMRDRMLADQWASTTYSLDC